MAKIVDATHVKHAEVEGPSPLEILGQRAMALQAQGLERTSKAASFLKQKTVTVVSDRRVQVAVASGASGAVVVGGGAAAVGLVGGGVVGGAIGILPALFTFGLSIPLGALVGAGCGVTVGGAAGGTVGFTGASAIGLGAYTKRAEIRRLADKALQQFAKARGYARSQVESFASAVKKKAFEAHAAAKAKSFEACVAAKNKAVVVVGAAKAKTVQIVSNKDVQAATASAVGGAVVIGTGGAATGTITGGLIGAAVGVVPALFTFGLSIPVCAVIGGGCGLVAGTAVGGTAGATAGAGGYCAWTRREAILRAIVAAKDKAQASAKNVQGRVATAVTAVKAKSA